MSLKRLLIGKPLKSTALNEQKLTKTKALAILSSDALSSVAYGPEQILIVLLAVGVAAFWYSLPIAQPLGRFIDRIQKVTNKEMQLSIVIPQFLPAKRWQYMLHNQTGVFLRTYLLYRKNTAIITVPYHIGLKQ